ncbi:MAG: hypothetical protein IT457_11255, partial [Planctomycetes bacterium]|nr:hypothetical protein [Planctomycetota bacterium]
GHSAGNPTTILVRPGSYAGNVALAAGIHLTAVVGAKSFATQISGQVTHTSGLVSMTGIDISASSGDALTVAGGVSGTQLYLANCVVYAQGADNCLELNVPTADSSGVIIDNVNFRIVAGGSGVAVNVLSGTLQGTSSAFWPTLPTTASLSIGGSGANRGRVWVRDCDVFGKVVVTNGGEVSLAAGQVRSGNGVCVDETSSGPVTLFNVSLQPDVAFVGNVVNTDGNLFFGQLSYITPFQTMPATATRLPASDALSAETFVAGLTNQATFTGSLAAVPTNLIYSNIQQNTAPLTVFDPQVDGSVIIRRAGVLTINASTLIGLVGANADLWLNVNGTLRAATQISVGGTLAGALQWTVAANDVVSIQAFPSQIATMSGFPAQNVLSLTWQGYR